MNDDLNEPPDLTEEDLVVAAEEVFLQLDREEEKR